MPEKGSYIIKHSRPFIGVEEEDALLKVVRSGCLSEGAEIGLLEEKICSTVSARAGIAVSSGTTSLHLALLVLGIKEGDEVVLPSYVCQSLLHAVRYVGANPVLADVGGCYNLTPETVHRILTGRTKAIIVPHMFGLTADLDGLSALGIPIIEDCAHALGVQYKGRPVGGIGILAVSSFYATKLIGAAGGGFLCSQNQGLIDKARDISTCNGKKGADLRYNYGLSNLQAAMALCQLDRLEFLIRRRKAIADRYDTAFSGLNVRIPIISDSSMDHAYYRYMLMVEDSGSDFRRRMLDRGVKCGAGVLEPLHRSLGLSPRSFPVSEHATEHGVSIPVYPALEDEEVDHVISAVKSILS